MWDAFKKQWNMVAAFAAWISTVVGGFWHAPPAGISDSADALPKFAQFFLTLGVGLIAIPVYRYRSKAAARWWLVAAVALLLLTPLAYFLADRFATAWTCAYGSSRVVIGPTDALTPHGKAYIAAHPNLTCDEIVWNHAGKVDELWTKDSIDSRRRILSILYVIFMPLFAGAMICVIQSGYCATGPH